MAVRTLGSYGWSGDSVVLKAVVFLEGLALIVAAWQLLIDILTFDKGPLIVGDTFHLRPTAGARFVLAPFGAALGLYSVWMAVNMLSTNDGRMLVVFFAVLFGLFGAAMALSPVWLWTTSIHFDQKAILSRGPLQRDKVCLRKDLKETEVEHLTLTLWFRDNDPIVVGVYFSGYDLLYDHAKNVLKDARTS